MTLVLIAWAAASGGFGLGWVAHQLLASDETQHTGRNA